MYNPRAYFRIDTLRLFTGILLTFLVLACNKKSDPEPQPQQCIPVAATGHLSIISDTVFQFTTSGGGKIVIDRARWITIMHKDYANFKIELWGGLTDNGRTRTAANHENLNGKHLKDRLGKRRTIIFPDGAKITLVCDSVYGAMRTVSIYDGDESHQLNLDCNTIAHSSTVQSKAREMDAAEVDGETGEIIFTQAGLTFWNIYTEDTPGAKVDKKYLLGEIVRDKPSEVNDYFDDPRLGHT
jgi:hypothetical protein